MAKLVRVIAHWTGGGGRASDLDKAHYHRLVEYDGNIVLGKEEPEDNIVTSDGDYAAHTLHLNTGSIGVAVCGMADAVEQPFSAGPSPITERQFRAFCILIADLCRTYAIPVTEKTVLTHAEVQHTLGVRQKGKWDIARLPYRLDLIGPKAVGDHMRELVKEAIGDQPEVDRATLRKGARGREVEGLQDQLARLGYFAGRIDGDFGSLTQGAVLAFQGDNGIVTDGVVGPQTWTALGAAAPKPKRDVSADDLRKRGSETIKASDGIDVAAGAAAVTTALPAVRDAVDQANGILPVLTALLRDHWPALLVLALLGGAVILSRRIRLARVEAARSGADLSK